MEASQVFENGRRQNPMRVNWGR